jgi:hypothetical protein
MLSKIIAAGAIVAGADAIRVESLTFGSLLSDGASDDDSDDTPTDASPGRVEHSKNNPDLKQFVNKDEAGKKSIASYKEAWDDGRFTVKDGKRIDEFGNTYSDDAAGFAKFVQASEKYWSDLADKEEEKTKGTSELRRDTQSGKIIDAPTGATLAETEAICKQVKSPYQLYQGLPSQSVRFL